MHVESDVIALRNGVLELEFLPRLAGRMVGLRHASARHNFMHMAPCTNGRFPLESGYREEWLDALSDRVEQWSHTELDANTQKLRVTWSFKMGEDNSNSMELTMDYRYLFPHQLELLLQRAGFQLERLLGDYEGLPFTEDSERLLVIAHFSR